jgi:hypothetical protein
MLNCWGAGSKRLRSPSYEWPGGPVNFEYSRGRPMLASDHSAFSTRLPMAQAALLVLLSLVAFGCTPKIGDSCTVSTNCSASGDRLCDITEPGGYCTIFNCEPDGCPDDSVCINFGTELSPVDQCSTAQGNSPYQRSFCMARCASNSDCRGGYECQSLSGSPPNRWNAVLADSDGDGKVCYVTPSSAAPTLVPYEDAGAGGELESNEVCLGANTGGTGGTSVSGNSGAGGTSGASSDAGAGG